MKIGIENEKVIIYLKKEDIKNINFDDVEILEEYFKDLIIKLKDIYDINISGFYNIVVYVDKIYGSILELEKEDIDYYIGSNQIEMRIIKQDINFLYEIEDILKIKNTKLYKKDNKYYLFLNSNISYKDFLYVLENSTIVYNNTDNIIKYGKLINNFNFKNFVL